MFVSFQSGELRQSLLIRYYEDSLPPRHDTGRENKAEATHAAVAALLSRSNMSLCDIQCHLSIQGASDLVVDLIILNHSSRVFLETIELGIALLEGGNSSIQVRLHVLRTCFLLGVMLTL